jgi:hypothetical protein
VVCKELQEADCRPREDCRAVPTQCKKAPCAAMCQDRACRPVGCEIACSPDGFARGNDGCEICGCAANCQDQPLVNLDVQYCTFTQGGGGIVYPYPYPNGPDYVFRDQDAWDHFRYVYHCVDTGQTAVDFSRQMVVGSSRWVSCAGAKGAMKSFRQCDQNGIATIEYTGSSPMCSSIALVPVFAAVPRGDRPVAFIHNGAM